MKTFLAILAGTIAMHTENMILASSIFIVLGVYVYTEIKKEL